GVQYPTDPERLEAVQAAGQSLEADGHEIVPLNWTQIECMAQECAQIFAAIIATNLADLEQSTDWDFSKSEPITQAAIEQGKLISGVELWRLMNRMVLVSRDLWQLFEGFDCLLTPMLSTAPKSIGSFASDHCDIDLHFDRMTAFSPLATLANVSGFPAITMPFGEDANGLPLPIQFLAPMGCEKLLLSLAARMETELRWQHKFPIAGLDR
ncbi:MAG: amidase family protein, partial [Lentilitoribacter sp.]